MASIFGPVGHCLTILSIIILLLNIISICIYCIPILCVRHLRTSNNLITVNVCFASILCASFWIIYFSLKMFLTNSFENQLDNFLLYIQTTVNCQSAFSLCVLSIYRFCSIIYGNKRWFNRRRSMILTVISQWIMAFLLPLPIWYTDSKTSSQSTYPIWIWIYNLCLIVILPTTFVAILDGLIFSHAHRSLRRVQSNVITHRSRLKKRNKHLLKRMFFMLIVSISGWTPLYIVTCLESLDISISPVIYRILYLLPLVAISIVLANLFLYNHFLRRYLKQRFFT
ncbi:hypothetical protein I4U23_018135 [Adineta vaga]|nr:hypothetical protein I4U23_018135 [Adineta vaga]